MNRILKQYIQFIKDFENELSCKYNIYDDFWNQSGIRFPKEGTTDHFKYNYHGAGCKIQKDGVVCEFDVAPLNGNDIKFSPWKLFNFINTNPDIDNVSKEDLDLGLSLLIEQKQISKLIIDGIDTGVYQVLSETLD